MTDSGLLKKFFLVSLFLGFLYLISDASAFPKVCAGCMSDLEEP